MKRPTPLLLLTLLLGCGGAPEPQPDWVRDPAPASAAPETSEVAPLGSLTLVGALAAADARHPELAEFRAYVAAAEGQLEQAGLFPNPTLVLRMENAPWSSGSTRDSAEYVAGLSFQLPLSGRVGAAEDAAAREVEQRTQELAVTRREVQRRVRGAFATALSLERAAEVQRRTLDLAERAEELLSARVEAGDTIPAELARGRMEATRARLELGRVEAQRRQAALSLAAAVGDPELQVTSVTGELETALALPDLDALVRSLEQNPRVAAADAEVALSEARVELAKAQRVPDVSLDMFYRRLEESDQHAFDVGVGIPLGLFDRNQGNVRSALAGRLAASARARATRTELLQELRATHARLAQLLRAVEVLRDDLLVQADTVLASAEARFAAGDASLVELLPIRRDWAALQLDYLDSLRQVMLAWSDLQVLTGTDPTP
ncbi:MAG: TolC family protein [Planctomycetota bacterium]